MAPHSSTLAWKIPWTEEAGRLQSGVAKSWTRLSDFTFTFHFHALEKEMATHSSVLAWRIPGTGEPGGLPSLGSHRVGHDWSDLAANFWRNLVEKLFGFELFFVDTFCLFTGSLSSVTVGLFRLSFFFSWVSFGSLFHLRNLSFSSKLSNLLMQVVHAFPF